MIKVNLANVCHLLRRALLVEAVHGDESALLELANANSLKNLLSHRCLARSCAARDSHKNRLVVRLGMSATNIDLGTLVGRIFTC